MCCYFSKMTFHKVGGNIWEIKRSSRQRRRMLWKMREKLKCLVEDQIPFKCLDLTLVGWTFSSFSLDFESCWCNKSELRKELKGGYFTLIQVFTHKGLLDKYALRKSLRKTNAYAGTYVKHSLFHVVVWFINF